MAERHVVLPEDVFVELIGNVVLLAGLYVQHASRPRSKGRRRARQDPEYEARVPRFKALVSDVSSYLETADRVDLPRRAGS